MPSQPVDRCIRALQRHFGDRLIRSAELLEPYAMDFGGIVRRVPAIVLRPQSAGDVVAALSIAADHGTSIATRGGGHSVSGQSLAASGIVLDMTALDTVAIDRATETAWLGAGASWKRVADRAFAHGLLPTGLTMIADVTDVCDIEVAARLVSDVIERPPVGARRGITAGLGCIASHPNAAPLFARPASQELALFSLLTEPSGAELQHSLEYVRAHSARGCAIGGKRYVYGFFDDWGAAQWAHHYGEKQWARFASAKRLYDPQGLLNPGCIAWS